MFGIILAAISSLFKEIASSIGKNEVTHHRESIYMMGFINLTASLIFVGAIGLWRQNFIFSLESLPTFLLRLVLEILQCHFGLRAITLASRGTFGFLRTLTIPLLLGVDLILGYQVTTGQIVGIAAIIFGLIFLFMNHGIEKKAMWWVLMSAINAVATISLYKYNITNFNSVEGEQTLMIGLLAIYFLALLWRAKERPWHIFTHRRYLGQALAEGAGSGISSFAYSFAPASIIIAIERAAAIFWSILSGNIFFKEKKIIVKLIAMALFGAGLTLIVIKAL